MKNMMKAAICGAALVTSLGLGMIAEAGSIPTSKVPLHTYAVRKITCYLSPGGAAKGWIDPGDYVIVNQIRGDGWAYGSYPVKNGRTSRWFKANDLVNNIGFANKEGTSPQNKVNVYRNASYSSVLGSIWGKEPITVVSNSGDSRQIIYKIGGGFKMGWLPSRDVIIIGGGTPYISPWDKQVNKQLANTNSAAYSSLNPFPKGQCTWYAWGRMKEVTGKSISFRKSSGRHARNWPYLINNCTVDNNLTSKCVAVRLTGGGGYGHVVFVEYVDAVNSSVYYTEDNVSASTNRRVRKTSISSFKNSYAKFIH